MQLIETEFADRLFTWTQLQRQEDIAIYKQKHKGSGIVRYEVVKIRVAPAHTWPNGETTPEREAYPGASSWGRMGWTFFSLEAAQTWANKLRQASETQKEGASRA